MLKPDSIAPLTIANYRHIFILTGAGISVASGLSTYRGPGGLWTQLDVERIADGNNLPTTLPELWELYRMRRTQILQATPNAAHRAIARLQETAAPETTVTLVTQNVDGLHRRAGSQVIEMHGCALTSRCLDDYCSLAPFYDETLYQSVPACPACGEPLRPGVVLFNENLNSDNLHRIVEALSECDLFIAVGTSGVVWPAARFVQAAAYRGVRTLNINVENSGNPAFGEEYLGKAEEILPRLLGVALVVFDGCPLKAVFLLSEVGIYGARRPYGRGVV